jgi:hypothetical protein
MGGPETYGTYRSTTLVLTYKYEGSFLIPFEKKYSFKCKFVIRTSFLS